MMVDNLMSVAFEWVKNTKTGLRSFRSWLFRNIMLISPTELFHFSILQLRNGRNPLDLIAPGSRLECQAFQDSLSTWIVTVVENIGGRLKLRYEGLESSDSYEHWLYYLDPFLHHVGWAAQQGYELQPPSGEEY